MDGNRLGKVILRTWAGGLGDSLLLSVLPEQFAAQRHETVLLYEEGFRIPEIKELIWDPNPYVEFTREYPTFPYVNDKKLSSLCIKYGSNIQAVQAYFGLRPEFDYIPLYKEPEFKPEYKGKTFIDCSATTAPFSSDIFKTYIDSLIYKEIVHPDKITMLKIGEYPILDTRFPILEVTSLNHLYSIIAAADSFICTSSGGSALASAIKYNFKPDLNIYCLIHQAIYNWRVWKWNNIEYFVTGEKYNDFQFV